jgi:hypothetical protein
MPVTFTNGNAQFPIILETIDTHTLTIAVAGVTATKTVEVTVIASQASITPTTATFDNTDQSATIL